MKIKKKIKLFLTVYLSIVPIRAYSVYYVYLCL